MYTCHGGGLCQVRNDQWQILGGIGNTIFIVEITLYLARIMMDFQSLYLSSTPDTS